MGPYWQKLYRDCFLVTSRDVEAEAGSGSGEIFLEAEAFGRKKLEAEANSEAFDFLRSRKHF